MSQANTPWEVGLGFTINHGKADFRGRSAVLAARGSEKVRNVGLEIAHAEAAPAAARLRFDGRLVGIVNSPCHSRRLGKSLALGHVDPHISVGTVLTLQAQDIQTTAIVIAMPVHDPAKSRTAP